MTDAEEQTELYRNHPNYLRRTESYWNEYEEDADNMEMKMGGNGAHDGGGGGGGYGGGSSNNGVPRDNGRGVGNNCHSPRNLVVSDYY